jgi:hypothetical protein
MMRYPYLLSAVLLVTVIALTLFSGAAITPSASSLRITLPIVQPAATQTANPLTPTSETCYFNWANRDLPLLTQRLRDDMDAAGLSNVTVQAFLFGENCIDYNTNQVRVFGAMETDIRVTVTLRRRSDFSNRNFLGNLTAEILAIIDAAPPLDRDGPMGDKIFISFDYDGRGTTVTLSDHQAADFLERDLRGTALLQALGWLSPAQMDATATALVRQYARPTTTAIPTVVITATPS